MRDRVRPLFWMLVAGTVLGSVACAPKAAEMPSPAVPLVWPPAPAEPRIQFVRTVARPEDLGITGGFLRRLGRLLTGSRGERLVRPMAVVVAPGDVLYVADPGTDGVHRFDRARGRYDHIQAEDGELLPSPVGLAVGPAGEVYVADSLLGQLLVIEPGSKSARPLPLKEAVGQLTGVAVDPTGARLYVVDTTAHRVRIFSPDGTQQGTFGGRGAGDGELNYPTAIWRDAAGRLLVTDSLNFRIQVFDATGRFLAKLGELGDATGDFSRPKGVATDRAGHIYVVDSLFHAVQIFDLAGRFLLSFGSQGQGPGEFWLPTGLYIGEGDTIYVADSHNRRIHVFRHLGGGS